MTDSVKIDPQEYSVWAGTSAGWVQMVGTIVEIQEFKFSFVAHDVKRPRILISELTSGTKVFEFDIPLNVFMSCDTKVKTLGLYRQMAGIVDEFLTKIGTTKTKKRITEAKEKMEREFGEMPEILVSHELEGFK